MVRYSFVLPIYNEQETLPELYERMVTLIEQLDGPTEVILVDDGSRDASYALMMEIHQKDPRFKVIHFARNFGHQIAISAGMDLSDGEATIIMDADLQDPPEVVLQMIQKWKDGHEIVYAVRKEREGETAFKKATASVFYRLLRRMTEIDMPADAGDFRLVDRKALEAFRALRENSRYVRGMFSWIGFQQTSVEYVRAARYAGETKYPLRKMVQLAIDAVLSFSNKPLRLALNLGFIISGVSFLLGVWALASKMLGFYVVRGWTSTVVMISFIGGVQLIVLGILGEYIGRIYEEVKNRPLYVVRNLHGFSTKSLNQGNPASPEYTGSVSSAPISSPSN